ncbi:MAG: nitroreductase [Clostridia bacterium]|nr:nitroreductase [Clostridia bacterium]MBQ1994589.1 nitroreductase [Clostridia bacterium]MBQ5905338.1 nitroreductase [Clostridia bacterium]
MIFKRKSFHIFRNVEGEITEEELKTIEEKYKDFSPLYENIKTEIRIVPSEKTTCKRGQDYCILLYSEQKDGFLPNIGYLGEQLDLLLASMNIGALWFGIGKTEEKNENGLDYVIMFAIKKVNDEKKFRKDMFKSKRKELSEVFTGDYFKEVINIARFAPSACNTQPWKVVSEKNKLTVYRYKKPGKRGIMPADKVAYYNRIDIGIFLLFLELCLGHENISFERKLFSDDGDISREDTLVAEYYIKE